MSDLVYQREQWQKRAQAAQDCADELGELAGGLAAVLTRNYFGVGCMEGAALFERLSTVLSSNANSLRRLRLEAVALSDASKKALAEIDAADRAQVTPSAR